jgi:PEP-CTERM motif
MKSSFALRSTFVAAGLGLAAMAAQASIVFDALTVPAGTFSNYNQCFACTGGNPTIFELGDIVTLAGTERTLDDVRFRMSQQTFSGPDAYFADITFTVYSVDTATLATTQLGLAVTNTIQIPSSGQFELTYDFSDQNIVMPDTIYYGISVNSSSANANGLRMSLWDYWSPSDEGNGPIPVGFDPGTIVSGPTDVVSIVYGRLSQGGALVTSTSGALGVNDLNLGFTPNVQITAVPEPETYGMMALGLLAVGAIARRRKQQA